MKGEYAAIKTEKSAEIGRIDAQKELSLIDGYKEMSRINLSLAENAVQSDNDALALAEQKLAECE